MMRLAMLRSLRPMAACCVESSRWGAAHFSATTLSMRRSSNNVIDEDELPLHLRAPTPELSIEDQERKKKTEMFLHACCTAPYLQDTLDFVTAAVTHRTLRDHHVLAMLRYWKNSEAGHYDAVHTTDRSQVDSPPEAKASKEPIAPQKRYYAVLQLLLDQCYVLETSSVSGVSPSLFTSGLLWFMAPMIRRVKEQHRGDKESDEDVLPNPSQQLIISSADIWKLVALMELHNVRVTSEVVLDGLLMLMTWDDTAWRRSHGGQPLADEVRKNRLEFIDAERNSLRERLAHERVLARRGSPQARREHKFSEVSPPPEA
ncbi:Hypothetical protein, putative [Bodo saltans]|uniref:Uncharacterized protein n=1 Tax=Bodo saltans TaxID=75058 RepID=A0A0S4IUI6_BODSA|nr:Hypothetical protein, putative [Bodo saltans]|eukprot:CUF31874.1 Hypothetical protein, putative [Bodo saltans]